MTMNGIEIEVLWTGPPMGSSTVSVGLFYQNI